MDFATEMIYVLCRLHFIKGSQDSSPKIQKIFWMAKLVLFWWISEIIALQDAIQGFYWEKSQPTLILFVIHYRDPLINELKCVTYCAILDHP